MTNVITPTGMVHLGIMGKNVWMDEKQLMPYCQRKSRNLRSSVPTDLPVTCQRCANAALKA